uniref:Ras-related protein Rab n=1 Tax=Lotharella oceanica TaxID=641309 RepID=A0A7S2TH85_9EUKA|mmetsp:Transcript_11377/g.21850  ORF Transcript_11377/g.21850 Transcript_11377/m.21850 type:complete len:210 (+) Transcript_11377:42-671(+)|eukprot:CAMPEP_0170167446 /NCGR_PEP_ID=MMETSP0040_2-20121228/851_1 /TAXON_ID=641309 /ORGANISM="Lotharella oceanica, Strain CCMP622" /LENGTH=209 /DNA_ID=CAMNT_0010405471 /DNA_START=42 /DNA_END=671 /DNA_ORIENTATION=-
MDDDDDILLKVLVVGDVAVGKTSLIHRYTNDEFKEDYKTTIGVEFALKPIEIDDRDINIQLWDIAGQDRFIGLLRNFYMNASAAIVVYDVTNPKTLENAAKWKADIDKKVRLEDGSPIPCILIGNKCDLREVEGNVCIEEEVAEDLAKKNNFLGSIETSAKKGTNVDRACKALVRKALKAMRSNKVVKKQDEHNIKLDRKKGNKKSGCC